MTEQSLYVVLDLYQKLQDLERKVKSLRSAAVNLTQILDGVPHAQSQNSRVEKLAVQILATQEQAAHVRIAMVVAAEKLTIEICDAGLTELEEKIMLKYYVGCLSKDKITQDLHISDSRFYKLRTKAVKKFLSRAVEGH